MTVVLFALASAAAYGLAAVLQHQAGEHHSSELTMKVGLLVRLVRSPRWLLGNLLDVVGFLAQLLALRHGPLTLVEPLLVTSLLFAFPAAALMRRRPVGRGETAAAAVVAGGLALFLAVARPTADHEAVPASGLVALSVAATLVVVVLVVVARGCRPWGAGLLLAVASGVDLGTMSAATSLSWRAVNHGVLHAFATWGPYAVAVTGAAGILLVQSAFNSGLLRFSLPTLTVVQPLVAIAIGLALLDERISTSGLDPLWETVGLVATVVGVYALAQPEFDDAPAPVAVADVARGA